MGTQGREWISRLPAELARQRAVLDGLLDLCESDQEVGWLVIGCSVARGTGDRLSDLDLAVGIDTRADFPAAVRRVRLGVERLGELVDGYQHQLPGVPPPHERIFVQFADRGQVDLVVFPASTPAGSVPDVVVLHDPDGLLVLKDPRAPVEPDRIREWAFRGWCALVDVGKYLRRRSPWEALERLHEARTQLWQLYAAAHGVPDPQYGITSILDFAPGLDLPEMRETVADLDPVRLLSAARRTASLLDGIGPLLPDRQRAVLPDAMARFVLDDLSALEVPPPT